MAQPSSDSVQNTFHISNSLITNLVGSGSIHYNTTSPEPEHAQLASPKIVLFLASNPKGTIPLRLDEEVREISAVLRNHPDQFTFEQRWAVRPQDMQAAVLELNPQIVHFAGHGRGQMTGLPQSESRKLVPDETNGVSSSLLDEGIILEDETGQAKLIPAEAIAAVFDSVECVVLNACYSEAQAEAIAHRVRYVIGMKRAILDQAAIRFSIGFYTALGAGKSIEAAYQAGCTAIHLEGIPDHDMPVLFSKPPLETI